MKNGFEASIAAAAALLALGIASAATAATSAAKEKCYGISGAGQNDCASPQNNHSCHNKSTKDFNTYEWNWVEGGKCTLIGGTTTPGGKK